MISLKESLISICKLNTESTSDKLKLILATGAGVAVGYFVYLTGKIYLNHRKYSHIPGPENKGILGFYYGHSRHLTEYLSKNKVFLDVIVEYLKEYGPIVKLNMSSGDTLIFTVDPEAIKELLVGGYSMKNPAMYNQLGFPLGERFLGTSMVIETDEELWQKKRAIFNPAFHRRELKDCMNEFNSAADVLVERLRSKADGKTPVLLHDELSMATMDTITNIAFGFSIYSLNATKLSYYVNSTTATLKSVAFLNPFAKLNPANWSKIREFKNTLKEYRAFAKEQIEKRMQEIENDETPRNDILTFILKSQNNRVEDMEAMIDDFIQFFSAGNETTSSSLGFFFLEIGCKKEVYEKVKKEIDDVIGSKRNVLYEDLSKLEYTACAFKETIRLHPVAAQFSRLTIKDMKINGLHIPKNTWISVAPYLSHRQEEFFPNALDFNPDRFLNGAKDRQNITMYTYYPFSMGPHNCIGQTFVQFGTRVLISKIMQNFDIELDMTQSFEQFESVLLKPKDQTRCFLTLRNQ